MCSRNASLSFSPATSASLRSSSARSKCTVAETSRKVTSVPPSGSGSAAQSRMLPSVRSMRRVTWRAGVERGDGGAQRLPGFVVGGELAARRDQGLDVRARQQRRRIEPPHLRECRIAQPQPAVAGEHRDRFAEIVERFALDADHRVEAAFEIEPFGHVVEQIGDAAFRVWRGDDAQACGRRADAIRAGAARPRDRPRAIACAIAGSRAVRAGGARRAGGRASAESLGCWSRNAGSRSHSWA